jgi:hypothetical protein
MDEIEVPLEQVNEHMHEAAHHAQEKWISLAALGSGVIAVIAAISAMLAGSHANEAMISQIKASNSWSYYQAKSVKSAVLSNKIQLLADLGKPAHEEDQKKLDEYKKEQDEITEKAKEYEKESEKNLVTHETLAKAVTLFQVAIAMGAIAVLSRKKKFWLVSLVFAAGGVVFFIWGLLR